MDQLFSRQKATPCIQIRVELKAGSAGVCSTNVIYTYIYIYNYVYIFIHQLYLHMVYKYMHLFIGRVLWGPTIYWLASGKGPDVNTRQYPTFPNQSRSRMLAAPLHQYWVLGTPCFPNISALPHANSAACENYS